MIGNINKISSREVFGHFYAEDGSSRCIHVFKSFLILSQVDRIKSKYKAQNCRTLVFTCIDRELSCEQKA